MDEYPVYLMVVTRGDIRMMATIPVATCSFYEPTPGDVVRIGYDFWTVADSVLTDSQTFEIVSDHAQKADTLYKEVKPDAE